MYLVRTTFTAKPGQAGPLLAQLKEMAAAGGLPHVRFLTDATGDFNTVEMEYQIASLGELEEIQQRRLSSAEVRDKAKGYTDHWLTGKRELYRIA